MPPISKTFIASLLGSLIVAGCGGGGSSGGTATTFPLSTPLANLYKTGFGATLNVSGTASSTSNGKATFSAQLQVNEDPANAGVSFGGGPAIEEAFSMSGNFYLYGSSQPFSSASNVYLSSGNLLLGIQAISYCVAATPGQYPATVTVGQAEPVVTYQCWEDNREAVPTGIGKVSFVVKAGNSPSTAIFSMLETFTDTHGTQTQFTQKNFLIDTSGNISFQSLSFAGSLTSSSGSSGVQLNFSSQ